MTELLRPALVEGLESHLPVVVLEGWPGKGKATVLRQWLRAESDEVRLMVDARSRPLDVDGVARLVLESLDAHAVPIDRELALTRPDTAVADCLAGLEQVRIALVGIERLDAGPLVDAVLRWCRRSDAGAILAVADATVVLRALEHRGVPHRRVTGEDLRLSDRETADLVRQVLPSIDEAALEHLVDVGDGLAGVLTGILRNWPQGALDGTVARDRTMALRWPEEAIDWPLPLSRFVAATAPAPRLRPSTIARLVDPEDEPQRQVERVVGLGVATLTRGQDGARVLRWDPAWRAHVLQATQQRAPDESRQRYRRVAAAAAAEGDHALAVVSLVCAGDLPAAAEAARERLWELVDTPEPGLWEPLTSMPVARLMEFPSLASLVMVLRLQTGHRVSRSVLLRELGRRYRNGPGGSPSDRFHRLATSMFVASRHGELDLARGAIPGLSGFAELLPEISLDAGSVSDLLMVAEALVRLDRGDLAAEAAAHAVACLELDVDGETDPDGRRLAHAELIEDMCARQAGDADPRALPTRPTTQPLGEIEVMARAVVRAWDEFDRGDDAAALAISSAAMASVDPVDWPPLLMIHLLAAVGAGDRDEVERVWRTHLASPRWRTRHVTAAGTSASARSLDALCFRVLQVHPPGSAETGSSRSQATDLVSTARALPLNAHLTNEDPFLDLGSLAPRAQQTALMLETTRAVRAGELERAAAALRRALDAAPHSGLVRVLLGVASPADLDRLREHAATAPECDWLADLLAEVVHVGRAREAAPVLSEREREVLALVRAGRTNPEIAESLFVSVNTVKFHRANLYRKFGVDTRDRLLAAAHRHGL